MPATSRLFVLASVATFALIATACATNDVPTTPEAASPRAVAIASAPPGVAVTPNVAVTPTPAVSSDSPSPAGDLQPIEAGRHTLQVLGTGTYPSISVKVPEGWYDVGGHVVSAGPGRLGELSVWDVGQVLLNPCHWQGKAFDPGPSVHDLVKALRAQPSLRYRPVDTHIAGYSGAYLEREVPRHLQSCDVDPDGAPIFERWPGYGVDNQVVPVAGVMDQLWVIDVDGQRLVVDAVKFCCGSGTADELSGMVESLRFVTP